MFRKPVGQVVIFILAVVLASACVQAAPRKRPPVTQVTVIVTDKASHKPVFQARLTLSFRDPDSRIGRAMSFSAKTDLQGKYVFTFIPMEPVVLEVTAPNHQSFGQRFKITQPHQVLQVELNPPQPLR